MQTPPRISVIIPTLNAASQLPRCLDGLLPGVERGLIRDLILSDGGSTDATLQLGSDAGADIVQGDRGRGMQLRRGAEAAKGDWFLFLHADTVLDAEWPAAMAAHIQNDPCAATCQLAFRGSGFAPWWVASWANLRTRLFHLPYGDQTLLISRDLYAEVGGYQDIPLMEDVAMARALKGRLQVLPLRAHTGADRYETEGWLRRGGKNLFTLLRYFSGADPDSLAQRYHKL